MSALYGVSSLLLSNGLRSINSVENLDVLTKYHRVQASTTLLSSPVVGSSPAGPAALWNAIPVPHAAGPGPARLKGGGGAYRHGRKNVMLKYPFADGAATAERVVRQNLSTPLYFRVDCDADEPTQPPMLSFEQMLHHPLNPSPPPPPPPPPPPSSNRVVGVRPLPLPPPPSVPINDLGVPSLSSLSPRVRAKVLSSSYREFNFSARGLRACDVRESLRHCGALPEAIGHETVKALRDVAESGKKEFYNFEEWCYLVETFEAMLTNDWDADERDMMQQENAPAPRRQQQQQQQFFPPPPPSSSPRSRQARAPNTVGRQGH